MTEEARSRLWARLAPVRDRHPAARWIAPESLHVTLVFIGAAAAAAAPAIVDAASTVVTGYGRVEISADRGGGLLGRQRDGIAWALLGEGRERVATLMRALDTRLLESGHLTATTLRAAGVKPHVTLARRATRELVDDLRAAFDSGAPTRWTAEHVVLYRSHLGRGGSVYEVVGTLPLAR